jgi:hypothetical protein
VIFFDVENAMNPCCQIAALLITGMVSLTSPAHAGEAKDTQDPGKCVGPKILTTTTAKQIDVDWCGSPESAGTLLKDNNRPKGIRVDERSGVRLNIVRFNYLHFSPVVEVETTVVESYATLDRLWKQVFGIFTLGSAGGQKSALVGECATVENCLARWIYTAGSINAALDRALRTTTAVAVAPGELQALKGFADEIIKPGCSSAEDVSLACALDRLAKAEQRTREKFVSEAADPKTTERLLLASADQVKLIDRLAAFREAVGAIEKGRVKQVKKQKAGTIVSVTITPAPTTPAAGTADAATLEYFVHSRLPVAYHVGYAYSRLADIKLEKVRTLGGADLFDQVRKTDGTHGFTAFMSYQLLEWLQNGEPGVSLMGSLGTDFTKPGERIYVGGTLKIRRVHVNFGVATATVEEGQNAVVENLGEILGARELFTTIGSRRNWLPFLGVSFGVF